MTRIIVVTGTDTGAGKTVLTALLATHLRASGQSVAALKPICSGGRDDARVLRRALGSAMTLDEINPWNFRAPLAPLLAARKERKRVELREIVAHVCAIACRFETTLVEGAGGLLSPLGEGFSTRELIAALDAEVIIVAPNQLGVINQVRLTLEALPPRVASRANIILMSLKRSDTAAKTNAALLAEFIGTARLSIIPWLGKKVDHKHALRMPQVYRALSAIVQDETA